jgi:hypothetical protein
VIVMRQMKIRQQWVKIRKRTKIANKTIIYRTLQSWRLQINILYGEETWVK